MLTNTMCLILESDMAMHKNERPISCIGIAVNAVRQGGRRCALSTAGMAVGDVCPGGLRISYERVNNQPLHRPESALLYQRRGWRKPGARTRAQVRHLHAPETLQERPWNRRSAVSKSPSMGLPRR